MPELDFLAQLEADIAAEVAKANRQKELEKLRRRATNSQLPAASRLEASEASRRLSAEIEADKWLIVSLVALFSEQSCSGCGSVHRTFLQYMEYQVRKSKSSTVRYVRTNEPNFSLPRETLIQPTTSTICADCCEEHGFPLLSSRPLASLSVPIAPASHYSPFDINESYSHAEA